MTRTARVLLGAWAAFLGYIVVVLLFAKLFGRVPTWVISSYVVNSIRYSAILLLTPVTIIYAICVVYRRGMKNR